MSLYDGSGGNIPPISQGPRLTRPDAILLLTGLGFTNAEAGQFLDESDCAKRTALAKIVQERKKERK